MIVRLLLAAVVAAALLGAAMPVVDDARHDHARTDAERAAGSIAEAIADLHRSSDPVPRGVPGAERAVTVDLPEGTTVTVGGQTNLSPSDGRDDTTEPDDGASDVVTYRVRGGTTGRTTVDVDVRVVTDGAVGPDEDGLVLRDGERAVLRYELVDGEPTVTVTRLYNR